jgi:hypothetical protein
MLRRHQDVIGFEARRSNSPLGTAGQLRCCRRARQPVRSVARLQFVPIGFDVAREAFLQMSADMKVAI